jgi:hypothetical protein
MSKATVVKQALPRLVKVEVAGDHRLKIKFRKEGWRTVRLDGLIERFRALRPLRDQSLFKRAKVADWGAAVGWTDEMAVSADTLLRLSEQQSPFSKDDFIAWQERVELSNQEAADALGLSLSSIKNLRSGLSPVSNAVAIACRAMEAEPVTLAAHYRPRRAGRPKAA